MTTQDPNFSVVFNREIVLKDSYLKNTNSGPGKMCLRIQRFYRGSNSCLGTQKKQTVEPHMTYRDKGDLGPSG